MISSDTLKSLLIRDKQFLKNLYDGPNILKNKRILISSNDNEINTLIKYLHFVTNGKIIINQENFREIEKHKKLKLLQTHVESKQQLKLLLNGPRQNKILFLLKLSVILPNLLYGLFNLESKLKQNHGV